MGDQERFRCVIYRGGTSKAVFFMENELPSGLKVREKMLMAAFGSPDVRQIDGLGGSDITTSKVAIIGPPSREDADVDYTFGQVLIDRPGVLFQGNCGNISSAVGPFAIDEGLVRATDPMVTVRIYNTNTHKILIAEVPVFEGKAAADGDFSIPGVPGTGAMIKMDWADTAGSATGKLLPTGNAVDTLDVEDIGKIKTSIVDAANPVVFVLAEDIGATGMENRLEINSNTALMQKLERIRAAGAEAAGIVKSRQKALEDSPVIPQISFIRPPIDYTDYVTGRIIKAEYVSFLSRNIFNQMALETYTGTGSICTAAAAMIDGTLVSQVASHTTKATGMVRIGHPRGAMEIEAWADHEDKEWRLKRAIMKRTARRLMEGYVYVKKNIFK
ncbi:MAG TPA: PrpF domain-containing protein [Desulfatiglandales bacterium]|nr:PrpF domain-containing protein [Desulfatiglandales bacterium]